MLRTTITTLTATTAAVVGLALLPAPAAASPSVPDGGDPQVRVVVHATSRAAIPDVLAAATRAGAEAAGGQRRLARLQALSLEVPASALSRLHARLDRRPDVTAVDVAHQRWLTEDPADPRFAEQKTYFDAVRATTAWGRPAHGAPDVRIAVVDSGADVTHPDLAGKVVGTFNPVAPGSGVRDLVGHGTGVASIAAAATNDGVGMAGAGYDSGLLVAKVADITGRIFTDDLAKGIVWAADSGADVINLSLGGPTSDTLEKAAVAYAQRKGALVVAAAGNAGTTVRQFPAALPGVLGVGATTVNGAARAPFSSYGSWVDVAAPGRSILLAAPGGGYEHADGTSFSSPIVAGQAALLAAYRPGRTAAEIGAAITRGATAAKLGFGGGLVDFATSLDLLPPATAPSITAPAPGEAVSGTATVTVATSAPRVRVGLGDLSQTVPAAGGVATATFPTYGLAGPQPVTAADCSRIDQCAAPTTSSAVVTNGPPALVAPSSTAGPRFSVTADAPGGAAVRFRVDGGSWVVDDSAPYAATFTTEFLSDGPHPVTAQLCRADGSVCDTAHPATATVTVGVLHPRITALSSTQVSPDGDGRLDTTTVRYGVDARSAVTLVVRDGTGRVVQSRRLGTQAVGRHSVVWTARKAGEPFPDGDYRLEILSEAPPRSGVAVRTVTVDTRAPRLRDVSLSDSRVLPARDRYLDTVTARATLGEAAQSLRLEIRSGGRLVRTVRAGREAAGPVAVTWNGRDAGGRVLPAGSYAVRLVATDAAGNSRAGAARGVALSAQRLVRRSGTLTVTARESLSESFDDDCSLVYRHTDGERRGWISYSSSLTCTSGDAYAVGDHQVRLPTAVRYGTVRLSAYGGRGDPRYRDSARVSLHDRRQNISGTSFRLDPRVGDHDGPRVRAEPLLIRHRVLRWSTQTTGVAWYDVRDYTVRFTYFELG